MQGNALDREIELRQHIAAALGWSRLCQMLDVENYHVGFLAAHGGVTVVGRKPRPRTGMASPFPRKAG